ncbi:hypothetical protein EMN47_01360 [Prolixibacteraceae bacterium JC049]|nr:hypothetical protein [Prolixibacteraceae bacterium JC049]
MDKAVLKNTRIFFIDNLRVFLTLLVVAHHWAIANGAPGDWYYTENHLHEIGSLLMSLFVATNQAFFMGFFFLIAGYFVPASYEKKGQVSFLKDRIKRLGVPLLLYVFTISPILVFVARAMKGEMKQTFIDFYFSGNGFMVGPLWFVVVLLLFSVGYWWFRQMFCPHILKFKYLKSNWSKAVGLVLLIVAIFFVRIKYPVGTWIPVLGLQPAHFLQYVVGFAIGVQLKKSNVLNSLSRKVAIKWMLLSQFLVWCMFPAIFILSGDINVDLFLGGFSWHSLVYVAWEQLVALSTIIGLLGVFKYYFNYQTSILKELAQNSYAIYVLHGIVLVAMSLLFQFYLGDSLMKFALLLIPLLLFCFLLAKFVRSYSFFNRIL